MLDFPRWKVWTICLVLLTGVLFAIPSLMPESVAKQIGVGGLPRVNLGLDLAGGSHLMLEAQTGEVAKTQLDSMEDQVRTAMRRATPAIEIGDISSTGGALSFLVRNPAQLDATVEKLRALTQPVGVTGQRDWNVAVIDSTRITMTPSQTGLNASIESAMQGATEVVRRRIDSLGTKEPTIIRSGDTRIVVQVPGLQDPEKLKKLIGDTAKLEFKLVDLTADPVQLLAGVAPVGSQIVPYPEAMGKQIPFAAYPPGKMPVIAVQRRAIITGEELASAQGATDQQTNAPVVSIRFNSSGAKKFGRVTQDNVDKPFAMMLDGVVLSAPNINEPILGGQAQISGSFTPQSAHDLAIQLGSGALQVPLKVIEERTVGPQLGADSIRAGVAASVVATLAVILFMLITYGRFGVYANLAVVLNVFIILAVMAAFGSTLTLPGIAGFVLTIGTAVDANVLINERIREEQRRGRGAIQAVELGYKEASRTIFEANTVHFISGVVMLLLGSGPVKGFAIVLLIGIFASYFTAVFFTRMLAVSYLRRQRPAALTI